MNIPVYAKEVPFVPAPAELVPAAIPVPSAVLVRVAPIFFLMPLLGTRYVPLMAKVGLALVISLIILPLGRGGAAGPCSSPWGLLFT